MDGMSVDKTESYILENCSKTKGIKNSDRRNREYLYRDEINRLIAAAKTEKLNKLWYCYFLLLYRHAYRVSELCNLKWNDIDFNAGQIKVNRLKNSISGVHSLGADEIKALKVLFRQKKSSYVFLSNQNKPIQTISVNKALDRLGKKINLDFSIHPHMIRHSAAIHFLENTKDLFLTQQFLGHKKIDNTLVYLKLTPGRLENVGDWYR